MNFAKIYECDIANGPGCRTSLFVSGCTRHCKGCHNPEAWDFDYGEPYTKKTHDYILFSLSDPHIEGLSILGGEPFEDENLDAVYVLVHNAKEMDKNVWVYTGFTWEQLMAQEDPRQRFYVMGIMAWIDVLVDGPFIEEEKDISLRFRGSRNQRIINVPESLKTGEVIMMEEYM